MAHSGEGHDSGHGASYYVKIWALLLVLLVVSVLGPELGHPIVTLVTAFGIAVVKALMVAAYFMHLNVEKKYIHYMLYTMLIFMGVFYAGVATDIMRPEGRNWENIEAKRIIEADQSKGPHAPH